VNELQRAIRCCRSLEEIRLLMGYLYHSGESPERCREVFIEWSEVCGHEIRGREILKQALAQPVE